MNITTRRFPILLPACLLAAAVALASCGGGGGSEASSLPLTAQTITFAGPGGQTFGTVPLTLSATASSGLAVAISSETAGVCTVSGTVLTLVSAGTCTLDANQAGSATYAAAAQVPVTFTVVQGQQKVSFPGPGDQTLGVTPPALVATSSSGLPVTITSQTTGVCTVSGSALTLVSAGTCTLAADQAGSANYVAAPQVPASFTVSSCAAPTPAAGELISFDNSALTYTVAAFNGDTGAPAVDPAGGCNTVGSVTRTPGSQYDGATFGTLPPTGSPAIPTIPFTSGTNTLTMRVYVPTAPALVHLKIENAANGTINYETEVNATQANTWQTLTFPLNAPLVGGLPGQAFNLANTYNKVSVFFGFGGVQGASAATYYFDDLTLVP